LLVRSKTNQKHVAKIRQPDGVGVVTKQLQATAATNPKYCSEYAPVNLYAQFSSAQFYAFVVVLLLLLLLLLLQGQGQGAE
jgi:hypothetical protein